MKQLEFKEILIEVILSTLNEEDKDYAFKQGVKWAVKHRQTGKSFDPEELKTYSPSFVKGYKSVMGGGWWDKFNSRLTDYLARIGYSRVRN